MRCHRPPNASLSVLAAMLCLVAIVPAAEAKKVEVTIAGLKFKPSTVEINVGDSVVWKNTDEREHSVTAEDGSFDSGPLASGKTYSKTFDKPGKFAYGSDPSPRTKGVVVVKAKS